MGDLKRLVRRKMIQKRQLRRQVPIGELKRRKPNRLRRIRNNLKKRKRRKRSLLLEMIS